MLSDYARRSLDLKSTQEKDEIERLAREKDAEMTGLTTESLGTVVIPCGRARSRFAAPALDHVVIEDAAKRN